MVSKKIVNEWLKKAEEDYIFAVNNLKEKSKFYSHICFHFHQSAEKFLKAYIIYRNLEFKKIHDLIELLRICESKDKEFSELREDCEFLNPFYIETRYPVFWQIQYNEKVANEAKHRLENIRNLVNKKMKGVKR